MSTLWEAPLLGLGRPLRDVPMQINDLEAIPGNAIYYRRQAAKNPLAQSAPVHTSGPKASPYISSRLTRSTKQALDPVDKDRNRLLQGLGNRLTKQLYYNSTPIASSGPRITVARLERYQNLDILNKLWNTFHISEGERIYAYRQIQRNRTLAQAYYKRLTLLLSYRHQYDEAMLNRQEVLLDLSRFLTKMKGSRIDLTYCITRLRYLTFKISSILNLARVICRKPVSFPDLSLSVTDLANWNLYLKQEAFYNRNTTAIVFTVLKFFGQRTFQEVQHIVNKYFERCINGKNYLEKCSVLHGNRDPDISYSCVSRRSHLNISGIAPIHVEQQEEIEQDLSVRISEDDVSLYLLLGLDAEAIFDGDNLAVKWNEFLSKRNGAYYWEDDPLEMQRFGKSDWVPLLKPQNIRDMVVLEPMIQGDVIRMLKLLRENSEAPVTIPLRNDISPFETYFLRPCGKKRVLAKKNKTNKKTCERLAQPKHPPKKRAVSKKSSSSRLDKGKKQQGMTQQNRPASRATGVRVPKTVKPPPPSTLTDTSHIQSDDVVKKSLTILPAINAPAEALRVVPTEATIQEHKTSDSPSMLQIIETLMSVLPRLESPRDTQVYDRFIYVQKRGKMTNTNLNMKQLNMKNAFNNSSFDGLLSSRPPLSARHIKSCNVIPTTSQLNLTMVKTPKVGNILPSGMESPVSSEYPALADRLWAELNEIAQQLMDADSQNRLSDHSNITVSKNGFSRSTMMESIIDLPASCLSPQHNHSVPKVIDSRININACIHEVGDGGKSPLPTRSPAESPDFGPFSNCISVASAVVDPTEEVDDTFPNSPVVNPNSNIIASLPNEMSIVSPPRDEYIVSAAPYLTPVRDLSVPSTSVPNDIITHTPSSSQYHESPLLDEPLPHCATARKMGSTSQIFVSMTSESILCERDNELPITNPQLHLSQLDITVNTSLDEPQPTPLEQYGVPIMNFNKIVYKLDEAAIRKQPNLIQYREKFRFLHTEDRSSPDYDFVGGEFLPVTKKLDHDTSENVDLLEYKEHYFDKPFLSKKFRKLERKQKLLNQRNNSSGGLNKPPKPKRMLLLNLKPRIPSAPARKGMSGIPSNFSAATKITKKTELDEKTNEEEHLDNRLPTEENIFDTIIKEISLRRNDVLLELSDPNETAQLDNIPPTRVSIIQRPDLLLELSTSVVSSSFRHLAEVSALSTPFTNASTEILNQDLHNRNRFMNEQSTNSFRQGSSKLATELEIVNLDALTDKLIINSEKSSALILSTSSSSSTSISQQQNTSDQPTKESNSLMNSAIFQSDTK